MGRAEWEAEADGSLRAGGFGCPQSCRSRWLGIIRVPGTELCSLNEKNEFLSTEVSLGVFWGVEGLVVLRLCSCTPGWPQTHHVTRDDSSVFIFQVMGCQACPATPESFCSPPPPQLCSLGWPGTHFIAQADLKFKMIPHLSL